MPDNIEKRLSDMGLSLPDAPAPAANYVPYVIVGKMVYISGQVSMDENGLMTGKVGAEVSTEQATIAARQCALSLIAQLRAACDGDLSKLSRVVKLTGFVNATPDYVDHPKVINGASDLMVAVFGDNGRHARAAVGCGSLPLGVQVEIEGIFALG